MGKPAKIYLASKHCVTICDEKILLALVELGDMLRQIDKLQEIVNGTNSITSLVSISPMRNVDEADLFILDLSTLQMSANQLNILANKPYLIMFLGFSIVWYDYYHIVLYSYTMVFHLAEMGPNSSI